MGMLHPLQQGDLRPPVTATLNNQTGIILVHLDKIDFGYVDQPVRYHSRVFQPKSELHITIVSHDAGLVMKFLEDHPDDIGALQDLIISTNWSYRKLPKFFFVEEAGDQGSGDQGSGDKETIIQMVEVPALRQFLKDLSKLIGKGFEMPPTHVTLYTRGTEKGIGLPTQAMFKQLARTPVRPHEIVAEDDRPAGIGVDQGLA